MIKKYITEWINKKNFNSFISYNEYMEGINPEKKNINKYFKYLNNIKLKHLNNEEFTKLANILSEIRLILILDTTIFKNLNNNNPTTRYYSLQVMNMENLVQYHDEKIKKYIKNFINKDREEKDRFIKLKNMLFQHTSTNFSTFLNGFKDSFNDEFYGKKSNEEKEILINHIESMKDKNKNINVRKRL